MPQLDNISFLPLIVWIFLLYVGGYLLSGLNFFLPFFNSMKVRTKRLTCIYRSVVLIDWTVTVFRLHPDLEVEAGFCSIILGIPSTKGR